jgi:hypothetical protein
MNTKKNKQVILGLAASSCLMIGLAYAADDAKPATPPAAPAPAEGKGKKSVTAVIPITVVKAASSPEPSSKAAKAGRAAKALVTGGEQVEFEFSIPNMPTGITHVDVTTQTHEILDDTTDSFFKLEGNRWKMHSDNTAQSVYFPGSSATTLATSQSFRLLPGQTIRTFLVFPTNASGNHYIVGVTGSGETETQEFKFIGGAFVVVE